MSKRHRHALFFWGIYVQWLMNINTYKQKKVSELLTLLERKTRLELATPTLARLCSTN